MRAQRKNSFVSAASLVLVLCGGCGGTEEEVVNQPPPQTWVNQEPIVMAASPGMMAVGDSLTVLGQHFVDAAHGKVMIRLKGTYFDSEGGTNAVDYQAIPAFINTGKLRWELWPNIIFDKTGDHLGRFVGHVIVLNQGNDGSQKFSTPFPVSIDIKPSLIPRVVTAMNAGCASMIGDTLEDQPVSLMVEVVGLREATADTPLTFYWTFMAEHWKVTFNYGTMDPSSIVPKKGAIVLEETVESGQTSSVSDGGDRFFLLKFGSDLIGSTRLKELRTGTIPAEGNNLTTTVNVAVVDASGKQAKLAIPLVVHRKADMNYDGSMDVIAERYAPQMVSDCIPGGDIGRDVNYHEASSESRARSMGFSWNAGLGGQVAPIPGNPFAMGINFSIGFGVNVNEHVSSDKSKSLSINGHILPGEYGAFYRQTTKKYRVARLVGYTACGQSYELGKAILTDWMFTPDLATGPGCPPPSKLQPAEKFQD
jgi:hypothetical protein